MLPLLAYSVTCAWQAGPTCLFRGSSEVRAGDNAWGITKLIHISQLLLNACCPARTVKDNAAEACTLACGEGAPGVAGGAPVAAGEPPAARARDAFDACYAKCVAAETREVFEEREAVRAPWNVKS